MRPGRADFPTVVRALGIALLVYAVLIDRGAHPYYVPTAVTLIFFKMVVNGRA